MSITTCIHNFFEIRKDDPLSFYIFISLIGIIILGICFMLYISFKNIA